MNMCSFQSGQSLPAAEQQRRPVIDRLAIFDSLGHCVVGMRWQGMVDLLKEHVDEGASSSGRGRAAVRGPCGNVTRNLTGKMVKCPRIGTAFRERPRASNGWQLMYSLALCRTRGVRHERSC